MHADLLVSLLADRATDVRGQAGPHERDPRVCRQARPAAGRVCRAVLRGASLILASNNSKPTNARCRQSLHSVPIPFTLRLCTSYLDLKSHPLPSSLLPSTASPSRRRTLTAASSSLLLDADSQSSTSSTPSIPHFALPTLPALLSALARLPKEVPTADPVEVKRRPAGARRAGWEPAARALRAHQVVKDVLLAGWCEAVGEDTEAVKDLLDGGKLERVRKEVERRVDEGRRRVESAV